MRIEDPDVQVAFLQKATYVATAASAYFGLTWQEAWWLFSMILGIATYLTSLWFQYRKDRREALRDQRDEDREDAQVEKEHEFYRKNHPNE
jgi:membrane protein implicated in regulation of membrane protease activity